MTIKDVSVPTGKPSWMKNNACRVSLVLTTLFVIVIIWFSPAPAFLSYSQLSTSQIQNFLSGPFGFADSSQANTTSESTALDESKPVTVHTDSPGAENDETQKIRPAETVLPDPKSELPLNTSSAPESAKTADFGSESPVNASIPGNVTSDVFVEEDTQLVVPIAENETLPLPDPEEKKYIMPLLSYQVGTGNQLMEYKSAATIARTLNRTLCLVPFFGGPSRHYGFLGDRHSGLFMEDRYDIDVLSKFVSVATMQECTEKCEGRLDVHWRLRASRPPHWDVWFNDTPRTSITFGRQSSKWSNTADIAKTLTPVNQPRCVGLGGLFPGLRWRGVMYAGSTYMQHSKRVMGAADTLQGRALGSNDPNYVSVHWRFEESNCRGHPLGLCFSRCKDGAVIANGRRSETWENMTLEGKKQGSKDGFNGVFVQQDDVSGAIEDRARQLQTKNIYLSTDGWLRGPVSRGILKWVVEDLRNKSFNVAGLWMIDGLPNFADGFFVHSSNLADVFGLDKKEKVSNHMIALVEQEICLRSAVFLGSGQSTWSLAVADTRRGRRCKNELNDLLQAEFDTASSETKEQAIIDKMLAIQYTAGPTCRGSFNATMTRAEDELPDGWLDYDSCEERLINGLGKCTRIS